ncbi:MAG: hypothetical protein V2I33_14285 [Kangiellaceae bacterium]|jgi:hypothetical protein|nr:hypothetical protein [Kangiellaceae bacterium]
MRLLAVAASALLLTACLDDSDDETLSSIDANNAKDLVEVALGSFEVLDVVEEIVPVEPDFSQSALFQNSLNKNLTYCGANPNEDTGNGSVDITVNSVTAGSFSLSAVFADCLIEPPITIDGSFSLDYTGDGDIGPNIADGSNTFDITYENLTLANPTENVEVVINGNINSVQSYLDPVYSRTDTVNLGIETNVAETTVVAVSFDNWIKTVEFSFETFVASLNISGSFNVASENGSFNFTMIESLVFDATPLEESYINPIAVSGQFRITAENGSSVTVTILNAEEALLEIDEDGDGVTDVTITVLLTEIDLDDAIED